MEKKLYIYALQNAMKYEGHANPGALMGKVMGEFPELRKDPKKAQKLIKEAVDKANLLSAEKQKEELQKLAPESFDEKKEVERPLLKPLKNAVKGKVVMRFAPGASGPFHIGHAYVMSLNSEYCRMYNGKFILRIEDTDSSKVDQISYDSMPEEANWITKNNVFKVIIQSDRLGLYYDTAEELINKTHAYVCTCDAEKFKEYKLQKTACPCRDLSVEENIKRYHNMFINYKSGEAVVRVKTDVKHPNPAMRDFPIMRINEDIHPRTGKKHKVWPLMNLSVAVDDHELGMTHVLRAKEHMDNETRQRYLFDYMGWKPFPETLYVGRINFLDLDVSKSKTKALIKEGVYSGWDDIRLPFLRAMKRRGIRPDAFIKYAISIGVTEHDKTVSQEDYFKTLYFFNREVIDSESNRFFFVDEPKKIKIENAPEKDVELHVHPDFPKRGHRKFSTAGEFYLTADDFDKLEASHVYRLMDCYNFEKKGNKFVYHSDSYEDFKKHPEGKIIHWLPVNDELVDVEVLLPDGTKRIGKGESRMKKLMIDNTAQLERFGYVRLDAKEKDKLVFWFAHK
jgi:glutamyl-tRNA synthetase